MITHFKYIDCHKMIAVQGSSTKDSNNFSWSLLMHIFYINMLFVSSFVINFWADREFVNFILKIYWGNLLVIYSLKGQIISECLFDFLNFPKNHRKFWQISAQEHERCWNHQNKDNALYYYNLNMIIWTKHQLASEEGVKSGNKS